MWRGRQSWRCRKRIRRRQGRGWFEVPGPERRERLKARWGRLKERIRQLEEALG